LVKLEKVSLRDILKISDMVISSELFYSKKYSIDRIVLFIDKAIGSTGKFKEILKSFYSNGIKYNYTNINLNSRSAETIYQKLIEMILSDDTELKESLIGLPKQTVTIQNNYFVEVEKKDYKSTY